MLETLKDKASELLGREVEVDQTRDGRYIVLFMSLTASPPPKGDTEEEALEKFIKWFEARDVESLPHLDVTEDDPFDRDL